MNKLTIEIFVDEAQRKKLLKGVMSKKKFLLRNLVGNKKGVVVNYYCEQLAQFMPKDSKIEMLEG